MNPIYKFTLSINGGTEQQVFPIYKSDITKDFELQTNEEFYRAKLSGKLTFECDDYNLILAQNFDAEFGLKIYISYDGGQVWTEYWRGKFYKTDCDFNDDDKVISVTPTVVDQYTDVLAGLEKEFDLIKLAPEIVPIKMDKRPMLQYYAWGQNVVGCYLSGTWWEQECEDPKNETALYNTGFTRIINRVIATFAQPESGSPELPAYMYFEMPVVWSDEWIMTGGGYDLMCEPIGGGRFSFGIRPTGQTSNWLWTGTGDSSQPYPGYTVHLLPVAGTIAVGSVDIQVSWLDIWSRMVTDKAINNAIKITANDIVPDMRNYHYAMRPGGGFEDTVAISAQFSATPTEWGLYEQGKYYAKPSSIYPERYFPLFRSIWNSLSFWVDSGQVPITLDEELRAQFVLRDAYPIASVISVLLRQFAPSITHQGTTDYSRFLYGETDPLTFVSHHLFITPKSNVLTAGYDQPAQTAKITLRIVLDMLRDCFRCYWFVDDQKRFRIEHIEYFRRGGSYSLLPSVGIDLTQEIVTRNGKPWAFGRNQYQFEKPAMAERYQFGWMDDVTEQFEGQPIDIISGYVEPGNIENVTVNQFTSDVDYMLLNPGACSKDGFALLSAENVNVYSALGKKLNMDGTLADDANYNITPFLSVTPGSSLTFFDGTGNDRTGFLVEYNANLEFVDYWTPHESARTITLSANTRFVRASLLTTGTGYVDLGDVRIYPSPAYKEFVLPYERFGDSRLQNGQLCWPYLQIYYVWDMPARNYKIGTHQYTATGVKKLKTQGVTFPSYRDPDMQKLVKTLMGNGMIEKLSLNLCSRFADATLRYDTE